MGVGVQSKWKFDTYKCTVESKISLQAKWYEKQTYIHGPWKQKLIVDKIFVEEMVSTTWQPKLRNTIGATWTQKMRTLYWSNNSSGINHPNNYQLWCHKHAILCFKINKSVRLNPSLSQPFRILKTQIASNTQTDPHGTNSLGQSQKTIASTQPSGRAGTMCWRLAACLARPLHVLCRPSKD